MPPFKYVVCNDTFELDAPAATIFPLLCPLREHDWIPTWKAEILHSLSGHAELDCTFVTDNPTDGKRIWICSHYDPDRAIGYRSYSDLGYFMCLDIVLEAVHETQTHVEWSRRFVATSERGAQWVGAIDPAAASNATQKLAALLRHFLSTGTMLKA